MIGQVVEKYEIKSEIGRGGMGIVYRGHQRNLNRDVAIKVLPPHLAEDKLSVERFVHEANLIARLNHENIVQIYDIIEQKGSYYIIMEFLDGYPLDKIIRKGSMPVTREEYIQFIIKVCGALERTHEKGVIHRDVKAANIFITHDKTVKLMDFGISKVTKATITTGMAYGTPTYMSPEQAQAKPLDPRTDLYSLGVVLYECMTGRVPFAGDDAFAVALKHVNEQPVPPIQIDPTIQPYLNRCVLVSLAKDREHRFRTCSDFAAALQGRWPEYLSRKTPVTERAHSMMHDIFGDRFFIPGMTVISLLISSLLMQQVPGSPFAGIFGEAAVPLASGGAPLPVPPPSRVEEIPMDVLLQQVSITLAARRYDEADRLLNRARQRDSEYPGLEDLAKEIQLNREIAQLQAEVNRHLDNEELTAALEKLNRLSLLQPEDALIRKLYDDVLKRQVREDERRETLRVLNRMRQGGDLEKLQVEVSEFLRAFPGDAEGQALLQFAQDKMAEITRSQQTDQFLKSATEALDAERLEEARAWMEQGLQVNSSHPGLLQIQEILLTKLREKEMLESLKTEEKELGQRLGELSQAFNRKDLDTYLGLWDPLDQTRIQAERESIGELFKLVERINSSIAIINITIEQDRAEASMNWKTEARFTPDGAFHSLFNHQVGLLFVKREEAWKIGAMTWIK